MRDDTGCLDELLGAWAQSQRLSDTEADGVYRAVLDREAPLSGALPPTWWSDLSDRLVAATGIGVPVAG